MHLPTIYTSPNDRPKFDFLQVHNYLGEFKSEVDKARVRYNLGISDDYSLTWGNILGSPSDSTELMNIINTKYNSLNNIVETLLTNVSSLNTSNTTITNKLNSLETITSPYEDLETRLLLLEREVVQNATNINLLSKNLTSSIDLSSYATQSWVTSLNYLTSSDIAAYATQTWVSALGYVKLSDLSSYATQSWVTSQIQTALGSDTLVSISCADITVLVGSSTGTLLQVKGTYSKSGEKTLSTSDYTVSNFVDSLISINNGYVIASNSISSDTTTQLTITSGSADSITVNVTIIATGALSTTQLYIGFGTTYQEAYNASKASNITDINGTWTNLTIPCSTYESGTELALFIITTLTITALSETGSLTIPSPLATNITLDSLDGYTVYRLPDNGTTFEWVYPVSSYSLKVTAQ